MRSFPPSNNPIFINAKYYSAPLIFFIIFASLLLINHQITHLRFIIILSVCKMLYVSHLVLYVYSYMSNVVNLYVRFSCMCIYCLYLRRRLKCLNHSAIHLTCLYIYLHPVLYMYMSYVVNLYVCLSCMCIVCICPVFVLYVFVLEARKNGPMTELPFQVKESNKKNKTKILYWASVNNREPVFQPNQLYIIFTKYTKTARGEVN